MRGSLILTLLQFKRAVPSPFVIHTISGLWKNLTQKKEKLDDYEAAKPGCHGSHFWEDMLPSRFCSLVEDLHQRGARKSNWSVLELTAMVELRHKWHKWHWKSDVTNLKRLFLGSAGAGGGGHSCLRTRHKCFSAGHEMDWNNEGLSTFWAVFGQVGFSWPWLANKHPDMRSCWQKFIVDGEDTTWGECSIGEEEKRENCDGED